MFAWYKARIAGVYSAEDHAGQFQVDQLRGRCSRIHISSIGALDEKYVDVYLLRLNGGSVSCKSSHRATVARIDCGRLCVGVIINCMFEVSLCDWYSVSLCFVSYRHARGWEDGVLPYVGMFTACPSRDSIRAARHLRATSRLVETA
jgi:hypothetical protein